MRAGMTINGMMTANPNLFDGLTVPAGVSKETLINTIIFNYGDLYFTNTDAEWTQRAIAVWSERHKYYLDELYKTLFYEYNPIENYDRYEEYTDTSNNTANTTTNSSTHAGVAGFDSAAMQPDSETTDNGNTQASSNGTLNHNAHIHGNIGVTTAAQMIQGQRDIINISWYDEAAKLFASEFMIMIY